MGQQISFPAMILGLLSRPWQWLYGFFLLVMLGLSFAQPTIHATSMAIRWPVLGLVAFIGLTTAFVQRRFPRELSAYAMVGFLAIVHFSALYSQTPDYTFQRGISLFLLASACLLGTFAYAKDRDSLLSFLDLLFCLSLLISFGGLLYRLGDPGIGGRYEGLHSRATGAGTYAALLLPISLYHMRFRLSPFWKPLALAVCAMLLAQIVLAGARAAILVTLVSVMFLGISYYGRKAFVGFIFIALLLIFPLVLDSSNVEKLRDRSDRIIRKESWGTFTGRLDRWVFGLEQFQRSPLVGHGFGMSRFLAGLEDPRRFSLTPGEVFNLHSDQIEVMMDLGMLGFFPFAIFWCGLTSPLTAIWRHRHTAGGQLGIACGASLLYIFIDTFMHGGFLAAGGGVSAFSWTIIGLIMASGNLITEPYRQRSSTRPFASSLQLSRKHLTIKGDLVDRGILPRSSKMRRWSLDS